MVDATLAQERYDFYVYVIFRLDGRPCYVGKGRGHRWKQHARKQHNPYLRAIYAKAGCDLPVAKIREGLTNAEACKTEIAFIKAIGRHPNGPLTNATDGGEGLLGHKQSKEIQERKSLLFKGKPRPLETILKMKEAAKHRGTEWLKNQSKCRIGKPLPEKTKASLKAVWLKKIPDLAERRIIQEITKAPRVPRYAKMPLTKEERSAQQAERNKGNKYGIGNKKTPEGQAKCNAAVAAANSKRVATEEYRELRRKIAKDIWAKRKAEKNKNQSEMQI